MKWSCILASVLMLGSGCAVDSVGGGVDDTRPQILALSQYEASVGRAIDVYGTNFPLRDEGRVSLHFVGEFENEDGSLSAVDRALPAAVSDRSTLRWGTFGPYENPFASNGVDLGTFRGTVALRVERDGAPVRESAQGMPFELKVAPSLVVKSFQPSTATCSGPVLRAIGGFTYKMHVEALGFDPISYSYRISAPQVEGFEEQTVRHIANGRQDTLGERGDFVLPEVPSERGSYNILVAVTAIASTGRAIETAFVITVRRPLDVYYNGNVQIAELEAPVAVSGCQPGGPNGRHVTYMETTSDTRTRDYSINWNENWLNMHTVTSGTSDTVGWHTQNGIGFATTDAESFRWSLGTSVEASFPIAEMVKVGVSANASMGRDRSTSQTSSTDRQEGVNGSETTTDTTQISDQMGGSQGGAISDSVSSTDTISRTFAGTIIADHYGVFYRQTVRMVRRAVLVAYNQCGEPTVVGDVDYEDWTWAPDLAIGSECPPLPASNLPRAQCVITPCGGGL